MRTVIAFALLTLTSTGAWTQSVVMYRCTDAQGAVTLQNDVPCPKGSKQVKRVIETAPAPAATSSPVSTPPQTPAPTSATPAMAAAPAGAPIAPAAPKPENAQASAIAERPAPPDLYRCQNYRREIYFSDTDLPPSRCLPLQTTGLDGNPGTGAGAACEMVRDACQRIADADLCQAWQQRLRDAESAVRFGTPEQAADARYEFIRAEKVMRESSCGG
ncbi:DUF4124 domain-containing protein [Luteimonas sp. SX5]|uniref:DUF4124 domain-containing protein n=1 Tax=Luteimonas galliterrae TaxID=2940486 RepID=A0ABT0MJA5_9GAMM|nr:DUF4124 domain-containing protein [Luteimonas galliterrae]MCL1634962.1 DUF4124 domain-containing protein [Luteimonas galliterrae]